MAKTFLKVAALFVLLACYVNNVCAQSDSQLLESIYKIYSNHRFSDNKILNINGKWYFVTVVNPKLEQRRDAKLAAYEKNFAFFLRHKIKSYPNYTYLPKEMTNVSNLEEVYSALKENKKKYYDMPQIGVKSEIGSEVYFFAKEITNDGQDMAKDTHQESLNKSTASTDSPQKSQTITLVAYGTADDEETAIKMALRSAIEQAFGTFVSSNTTIVNDELTKDEIVSVSSGNIEKYSIFSSTKEPDGKSSVSVKATVSIGKLIQFAQSKGATAELAGATFAMNMKMRKLNKENEYQAICHTLDELIKISELNLFDFKLKTEVPQVAGESRYRVPTTIVITPNKNYNNLVDILKSTIESLSLSEKEQKEYELTNDKYYKYDELYGIGYKTTLLSRFPFVLRNDIESTEISNRLKKLNINIWKSAISFEIRDNLGNATEPICANLQCPRKFDYRIRYKGDVGCFLPLFGLWPSRWIEDKLDIYGIASKFDSSDDSFLGDKASILSIGYEYSGGEVWGRSYQGRKSFPINYFYVLNRYIDKSFGLMELSGKSFDYPVSFFYNEYNLSKLSSITIKPTNPKDIKHKKIILETLDN